MYAFYIHQDLGEQATVSIPPPVQEPPAEPVGGKGVEVVFDLETTGRGE